MRVAETGVCQWCNETFVVGDDYCEGCGKRLTPEPEAGRDASVEVDLGFAASVSNRGLVHQRNEDAVHDKRPRREEPELPEEFRDARWRPRVGRLRR